ncbi:D-arabinose 1-dehydrogenase [NAD(P)+]-like protein [Lasiosphaeria hispida]|uniref:D-arabinose 1-dehydrogenase [NAD(P)+]-like protein n=1 Tax=Lasiosphaeria hispida TaxID=260671 RepID=A0AAJ0HER6_9PEZI|nr:D-arabinose 1-dehydrogenase [NAD(P)+]-like protein [Lasiosphaeria hispida]
MSTPSPSTPATARPPPLHTVLPPLILGTATFNTQYVADPLTMPYRAIVSRALDLGVTAFDTSPYYGPSEILLGTALDALMNPADASTPAVPRSSFRLVTKAGRIAGDEFDYSPAYIRYSVLRSLARLHTPYLDLVYTHDVEFVSPAEVLDAVRELRRLRDEEGVVRYVGISGFPVDVLCELAEMIYAETGEPLDAVLSYGHFTVQNRRLGLPWVGRDGRDGETEGQEEDKGVPLARLKAAGVDVVLNASMLGMGLLTSRGIPADSVAPSVVDEEWEESSPLAVWHPSPPELRLACKKVARIAEAAGERLESVAIRWAMEEWARVGAAVGVVGPSPTGLRRVGATVCGVSSIAELEETVKEWREVLVGIEDALSIGLSSSSSVYNSARQKKVLELVEKELWPALETWKNFTWASPGAGFMNSRLAKDRGTAPDDGIMAAYNLAKQRTTNSLPAVNERRQV